MFARNIKVRDCFIIGLITALLSKWTASGKWDVGPKSPLLERAQHWGR